MVKFKGAGIIIFLLLLCFQSYSQDITLEYIFQDTNIINHRSSLKFIHTKTNKMYYYGDDDNDGKLSMFDYNYITDETYKYSDTGETASEFVLMHDGNAISIIKGDVYVSKDFANNRTYTKDLQITNSDKYEYSPVVIDDAVIYRRGGNYYMTRFYLNKPDTPGVSKELELTNDESDSISYQMLAYQKPEHESEEIGKTYLRILFARYDNTVKRELVFPDYMGEFVKGEKRKRGVSKVKLLEYEIRATGTDSLSKFITEIKYPDSTRYSTIYANYSPNTRNLLLDVETLDRHNRKIFNYNTDSKSITEIYSESDNAWYERHSNATVFFNNNEVIFESESSDYNNIYKIKINGTGLQKIAGGEYTILESVVDRKKSKVYFSANKEHPYEYFIYETDFSGLTPKQLTSEKGDVEELRISGDGSYLFYMQSYITKPDEMHYLKLSDYTSKQITNSISPKFSQVEWRVPELITFNNEEDGQTIYAFLYKPDNFNQKKKYPLICFAHGAGYLQNVTYGFSPYRDNFMVNTFFMQQGFVVLDIDFRGSSGYGKEFRNKTYRNLGYWEVSDYISGINYLSSQGIIDKEKIGIYGGSYGGFITLMALFRHPEIFKCGVALRAVSNWKNYYYSNWWYTLSRLGDLKNDDVKQYYEQSSPITYADGLQGPLLMSHGMLDDNVFFQDMVQLTQKLIDSKKDFEVMFYPKENHSFSRQSSWLDQYKRIWKFFEKNLKK
jgi:dipeptidyl aminopeptidase/acylaminoacyl peptidase